MKRHSPWGVVAWVHSLSLREYRKPVFVYIPPGGELRGGAWVVVDPTINLEKMEMYADVQARGKDLYLWIHYDPHSRHLLDQSYCPTFALCCFVYVLVRTCRPGAH